MKCCVLTNWISLPSYYVMVWSNTIRICSVISVMLNSQFTIFTFSTRLYFFMGEKKNSYFLKLFFFMIYQNSRQSNDICNDHFCFEWIWLLSVSRMFRLTYQYSFSFFHYPTFPKIVDAFWFNKSTYSGLCFLSSYGTNDWLPVDPILFPVSLKLLWYC